MITVLMPKQTKCAYFIPRDVQTFHQTENFEIQKQFGQNGQLLSKKKVQFQLKLQLNVWSKHSAALHLMAVGVKFTDM